MKMRRKSRQNDAYVIMKLTQQIRQYADAISQSWRSRMSQKSLFHLYSHVF